MQITSSPSYSFGKKLQTTFAGSPGSVSPYNSARGMAAKSSFGLALPEVRVPLEALPYEVVEAGGEGPQVRVQG